MASLTTCTISFPPFASWCLRKTVLPLRHFSVAVPSPSSVLSLIILPEKPSRWCDIFLIVLIPFTFLKECLLMTVLLPKDFPSLGSELYSSKLSVSFNFFVWLLSFLCPLMYIFLQNFILCQPSRIFLSIVCPWSISTMSLVVSGTPTLVVPTVHLQTPGLTP